MSVSIRLQRGIARGLLVVLLAGTGCALWRTPEGPQADPSYPIEVAEAATGSADCSTRIPSPNGL